MNETTTIDPDRHPNGVMITGAAVITILNGGVEEVTIRINGNNRQITLYDLQGNQSVAILGQDGTIINTGNLLMGPLLGGARTFEFLGSGRARGTGEFSVNSYLGPNQGSKRVLHFDGATAELSLGIDQRIRIDGNNGDILFKNADCAEEFCTTNDEKIDPGTVVVLGESRRVKASSVAYDPKVIGIVSGAGDLKAGIVLGKSDENYSVPVALLGTVYCKATTENGPISEGDLLTTSSICGHAMRATDLIKYPGSIIGKSLGMLQRGDDIIPVLVTLR
jgi:hypothetical protein